MNFSTTKINRRNILAMSAAGSAGLLLGTRPLACLGAVAKDLSRVELRVARNRFFPANLSDLWERAGVGNFPYKIKYAEFLTTASAVEAMNADALDVGLASEPAAAFASASGAQVKLISSGRLDDNAQASDSEWIADKDNFGSAWEACVLRSCSEQSLYFIEGSREK